MTVIDERGYQNPGLPEPFYQIIGRIASDWALLEHLINTCIWAAAGVDPKLGACVTAQIYTLDGRIKALVSILRFRGCDQLLIDKINKFGESVRGAADKRNRIIHDSWASDGPTGVVHLTITANRKLNFEFRKRDLEDLKKDYRVIFAALKDFNELRNELLDLLPTFPEIHPSLQYSKFEVHDPKI